MTAAAARFTWPVRVYYEDTDAGGVVYHANYLRFMERARTERLRALGLELTHLQETEGLVFAVRGMEVDYLRPARLGDQLLVTADVDDIKRVSLTFRQAVYPPESASDAYCTARVRVVCLSADGFRPMAMPDHLLERIRDVA
ncbi:tol-pal system-associated acyl-CoA thioesterase [Methylolobus aquaticus]